MADLRIRPHAEQELARERRAAQTRRFRRNQGLGLVLLAAAILVFWLVRAPHGWVFPPGWWRP